MIWLNTLARGLESEAELPMRQGGAAAPPTTGVEPLVPLCLLSFWQAIERRRSAAQPWLEDETTEVTKENV
jgi:hypothetical protein